MGTRCWSFIKGRLFTPFQQLRKTSETFATSSLSKRSSTSKEDMRMFLVVAFLINAGCLASALQDYTPVAHPDFIEETSPTCFYSCAEYKKMDACESSWAGCYPESTYSAYKVKDFCQATCAAQTTTTVSTGKGYGKWCGADGECASGHCCGGVLGIFFQQCGECCENTDCTAGWRCNGHYKCAGAGGNGQKCDRDSDCSSGNCIADFFGVKYCRECGDHSHCNNGRYSLKSANRRICENNACVAPKKNGQFCVSLNWNLLNAFGLFNSKDESCASGHCCEFLGIGLFCEECCEGSHCASGKCGAVSVVDWSKECKQVKKPWWG